MKKNFKKLLGLLVMPFLFITSACTATNLINRVYEKTHVHAYEHVNLVDSTCTSEGLESHYYCKGCGYYFNENLEQIPYRSLIISMKEHNYKTVAKYDATCTHDGHEAYLVCKDCGHVDGYKVITKLAHDYETKPGKDATCTEDGYTSYQECKDCHDIIGKDVIKAFNHDFDQITYTWSNDNLSCTALKACKNDSAHNISETVNTSANVTQNKSCTKDELTTYTATFTNSLFTTQTKADVVTDEHEGHKYESQSGLAATCTTSGYTAYTECSVCHDIQGKTTLNALGHDFTKALVQVSAVSDLTIGSKVFVVGTYTIDEVPTNFYSTGTIGDVISGALLANVDESKAFTLVSGNTEGSYAFMYGDKYLAVSSSKNKVQADSTLSDASSWTISVSKGLFVIRNVGTNTKYLQFNYNSGNSRFTAYAGTMTNVSLFNYVDSHHIAKTATCDKDGNNEYYECLRCHELFDTDKETSTTLEAVTIKAAHTNLVKTNKQDSTCKEFGVEEYWHCLDCDKYYSDANASQLIADFDAWKDGDGQVAKASHNMSKHDEVPATEFEAGVKEYWTCSNSCCDGIKYVLSSGNYVETTDAELAIAKLHTHNLIEQPQVDATCTVDGHKHYYYCDVLGCGEIFEDSLGNTPIDDIEAWKLADGKIAATDHDFTGDYDGKDATQHWHICNNEGCDSTDTKENHTWDEDYHCTVCGYEMALTGSASVETDTYATAHSWTNGSDQLTIVINDVVTAKGTNSKFYDSGRNWRHYNGGTFSIECAAPYAIKKLTVAGYSSADGDNLFVSKVSFEITATTKITKITVDYVLLTNQTIVDNAKNSLTLNASTNANFYLPNELNGASITWASNNAAIAVAAEADANGYLATITQGDDDVDVTLTATITKGTKSDTKDIAVKVLKLTKYSLTIPTIDHVTITQDGTSLDLSDLTSGTTVNFNVTLDDGYQFSSFKYGTNNITVSAGKFSITMTDDFTVSATTLYYGTSTTPLTVDQAVTIVKTLSDKEYSAYPAYVTGTLIEIQDKGTYVNYILKGSDGNLTLFKATIGLSVDSLAVGDTIVVYGYFELYGTTYEMAKTNNVEVEIISNAHTQYSVSVNSGEFTTDGLTLTGTYGTAVSFTITPTSGYVVTDVTLNGNDLTDTAGTYTFNIGFENEIEITVASSSATYSITVNDSQSKVTSDLTDATLNQTITLTIGEVSGKKAVITVENATKVTNTTYTCDGTGDIVFTVKWAVQSSAQFKDMTDFTSWGTSYSSHSDTINGISITLASANKSTSTITDCPVSKGGKVTITAGGNEIVGFSFTSKQWSSKTQTITIKAFDKDGKELGTIATGNAFANSGVTTGNFSGITGIVTKIEITFSSTSNQIGYVGCSVDYIPEE